MAVKLKALYDALISEGLKEDFRNPLQIEQAVKQRDRHVLYNVAVDRFFDNEDSNHPYADARILYGDEDGLVNRILVGIDIDTSELLLAHQLNNDQKGIDLVLSHHADGRAWSALYDVMTLQADRLVNEGCQKHEMDAIFRPRISEMARKLHGLNHQKTVDAATRLDIPLMCCHTPSDNCVAQFWTRIFEESKEDLTLGDMIKRTLKEREYQIAAKEKVLPFIANGSMNDLAGRTFVDMTGGASAPVEVYSYIAKLGYKTIYCMHMSDKHIEQASVVGLNVVCAGHIASDNLGMNIILDRVCKRFELQILECSGFRRVVRQWD